MDARTRYHSLEEPHRSDHLWRYTPWRRIHPTGDVDNFPAEALPARVRLSRLDGGEPLGAELRAATTGDLAPASSTTIDADSEVAAAFIHVLSEGHVLVLDVTADAPEGQTLLLDVKASGHVSFLHLIINAPRLSHFELVTSMQGDAGWFGLMREFVLGDAAHVSDLLVNQLSSETRLLRCEGHLLNRDSRMHSGTLSLGGSRCKSDLRADLAGRGSELSLHIATHGQHKRHDDHHMRIRHLSGDNQSRVVMHAACDGRSRSIGTGRLIITEGANGTDAGQVFRNLLLSERAKADAIPELEVLADEVLAAHGAASSPLDSEQMFYLMSRGLDEQEAKGIILEGFLLSAFRGFASRRLIEWAQARLVVHLDCGLVVA